MSIISLENVCRRYRAEPVLDNVTLGVEDGEKLGIIGVNGCGKSTLLRLIAGRETADAGRVVVARGTSIAYLAQNPVFDDDLTVLDAVFVASTRTMALLHDYEQACREAGDDPEALARVADLASRLEACGGWDLETNARAVLSRLGVPDVGARIGTLSGGQRKRVALAHALITRPDLLILDEPTNHLDTDAVAWLERYLQHFTGTLLLVTHDRYFLDRVTTRTLEIERGAVQSFVGNYAAYLEKKEAQEAQRVASDEKRAGLLRRELEWLRRGARARATKQKAHVERATALLEAPRKAAAARLEINVAGRRLGTKTIEMRHVSKAYDGSPVVTDFTCTLDRGKRLGIIGPNGCGKTTLLDLLAGRLPPDRGDVERGPTVAVGYYDQESRSLDEDLKVIDYIREEAEQIRTGDGRVITASQMLERFLFPGPLQHTLLARLSGGERRRLYLLRVLMGNPNVLLLDEPTNDLDIPTLQRLEDYLDAFGGCLVVVSHDRYFLDRTVDAIFRFEPDGRLREFAGNFSDSEAARSVGTAPPEMARKKPVPLPEVSVPTKTRKMSMRERMELQALEAEIEKGEARRKTIEKSLAEDSSDFERTHALYEELQALTKRLDQAMERWAVLAELPQ